MTERGSIPFFRRVLSRPSLEELEKERDYWRARAEAAEVAWEFADLENERLRAKLEEHYRGQAA